MNISGDSRLMVATAAFTGGGFKCVDIVRDDVNFFAEPRFNSVEIGLNGLNGNDQMLPEIFNLVQGKEFA
jgi:hypothetical protein